MNLLVSLLSMAQQGKVKKKHKNKKKLKGNNSRD